MAVFNIHIFQKESKAPTVDDNSAVLSSKVYTFKTADFTLNFLDDDGDLVDQVILKSLPEALRLELIGVEAKIGDSFSAASASSLKFSLQDNYAIYNGVVYQFGEALDDIIANYDALGYKLSANANGSLEFTSTEDATDIVYVKGVVVPNDNLTFEFAVTDDSLNKEESNIAVFSLIPTGSVNVKSIYVNNPPVIGDNTLSTHYNVTRVFAREDFIEDTDPRFSDPEGDQPFKLKVLSLPSNGVLYLRDVAVTLNQEMLFVGDIDQGVFKYTPDSSRIDIDSVSFEFTVSDTGSKTFA